MLNKRAPTAGLHRLSRELSDLHPAAKWAPPAASTGVCRSSAAAVELEVLRASALDRLRKKLTSSCLEAGLNKTPLLAFERWRFTSKWLEEEEGQGSDAATKAGKGKSLSSLDPVLPSCFKKKDVTSVVDGNLRRNSPDQVASVSASGPATTNLASLGLIQDLVLSGMSKVFKMLLVNWLNQSSMCQDSC